MTGLFFLFTASNIASITFEETPAFFKAMSPVAETSKFVSLLLMALRTTLSGKRFFTIEMTSWLVRGLSLGAAAFTSTAETRTRHNENTILCYAWRSLPIHSPL